MRDIQAKLGQTKSLELDSLSRDASGSAVNESAVLVDNINDGDQLAGICAKVNYGDAANLNEVLGWL